MKKDTRSTKCAVYLMDDLFMHEKNHQVPSGYDLDARGAKYPNNIMWQRGYLLETDDSLCGPATLSRRFMPVRNGKAGLTFIFTLQRGNGFFTEFLDDEDNRAFTIYQKDGVFFWNDQMIPVESCNKTHSLAVDFDMDNKEATVCFGGKFCGKYKLLADNIARYIAGYRNGDKGCCKLNEIHLHINYLLNDKVEIHEDGPLSYGWNVENSGDACAYRSYYYEGFKHYVNVLCASKEAEIKAERSFDKACGIVEFEIKYLSKNIDDEGITLSLTSGGKECVSLHDNGTKLTAKDGSVLRKHNPYVWQTLNIKADTETQKCAVMLNGKKCGQIAFDSETKSFDGISIGYCPAEGGVLKFGDVLVSLVQPEPEDYPKPPVLPEKDERYFTGMNICSLWHNGEHIGWDAISAFHDNLTYLGFYDEGLPEVADWEIKWMAEHGLDCEFYCWYATQTKAPNMKTMLSDAIHNGHFKAKYADYMRLALIWEAGAGCPATPQEVEKYYIPYFEDYFFTDPRYFAIDNVAIMSVYNIEKVARDLGGFDKVREVVELLRASAKRCGFRDLAIITCGEPSENRKIAGVDAIYAYGWGHYGYEPNFQIGKMKYQMSTGILHVVPTVSVGYNDVAWRKDRFPMISCEDMGKVIKWFKDDVLPSYENCDEDWQKKLIMFSTWNEYGEGTYICPANLNGFGYLNEMRKAVTKNADAFESDRPSKASLDRIGYLYPKGRQLLSALLYSDEDRPEIEVGEYKYDKPECIESFKCLNGVEISFEDGKVIGKCSQNDPQLIVEVDIDASKVDALGIKMLSAQCDLPFNRDNPFSSPIEVFFRREGDAEFHGSRRLEPSYFDENKMFVILTNACSEWNGRITHLRFDPTPANGRFEFEEIKLLAKDPQIINYETYIDNVHYDCHFRTKAEDGKYYISFEPLRQFPILAKLYYEWDVEEQTLMIKSYKNKVSCWTIGKDTALIDGMAVKLSKAVEFFDGLPYLPLDELCFATDSSYEVVGNEVRISTNI